MPREGTDMGRQAAHHCLRDMPAAAAPRQPPPPHATALCSRQLNSCAAGIVTCLAGPGQHHNAEPGLLHGREGAGMHEAAGKVLHPGGHRPDALAPLRHLACRLPRVVAGLGAGVPPKLDHAVQHACRGKQGREGEGAPPHTVSNTATHRFHLRCWRLFLPAASAWLVGSPAAQPAAA